MWSTLENNLLTVLFAWWSTRHIMDLGTAMGNRLAQVSIELTFRNWMKEKQNQIQISQMIVLFYITV